MTCQKRSSGRWRQRHRASRLASGPSTASLLLEDCTYAAVAEPYTAILAALAGALFGGTSNWIANIRRRDDAATVALIELSASVKHIDKTLQRFETAFESVNTTLHRHDHRINRLEAGKVGGDTAGVNS